MDVLGICGHSYGQTEQLERSVMVMDVLGTYGHSYGHTEL